MQGYNLEVRHIPSKRNPADTLSRQDKKDALGRKTAVHDANADLVRELRVPSFYGVDCSSVGMRPTGWERHTDAQTCAVEAEIKNYIITDNRQICISVYPTPRIQDKST